MGNKYEATSIKKIIPESFKDFLSDEFYQRFIIENNKVIGKGYEKMFSYLYIDAMREKTDISKLTIEFDKTWLYCFEGNTSKRRYDVFIKELLVGFEIKSSRIANNKFIKKQIAKDKWLLDNRKINEARWILFSGATENVKMSLTKNKILYIDISADENNLTNLKEVYYEKDGIVLTSEGIPVIPVW